MLTTQVLNHSEWTAEIVDNRQKELLAVLEQHWRLEDRENPVTAALPGEDGTWRDDVREGLHRLGGRANLNQIYKEVESLRRAAGRPIPPSFEASVRRTLEDHSSDSDMYKGGPDLFCMPEGKGKGVWALREN